MASHAFFQLIFRYIWSFFVIAYAVKQLFTSLLLGEYPYNTHLHFGEYLLNIL